MVDQKISDDSEWCSQDGGSTGCRNCIGIKKGTLVVKPNYAMVCPEYRMYCEIAGIEFEIDPEDAYKFPCYPFGENCTASTMNDCLDQRGCGWCNGGGRGRE